MGEVARDSTFCFRSQRVRGSYAKPRVKDELFSLTAPPTT
jgi:hypothetical protein